jgi:predicted metal-dependent phosphotriesterase family hydrolase
MSDIVRTVLGDISSSELGATDAHEHLFLSTRTQPGEDFSDLAPAIEEARTLVAAGADALVDWTPIDLGRDLEGLRAVSRATGLHVVAATGIHADAHYAPEHPLRAEKSEALAERFVADIGGGGVRCGVIKIGASYHRLLPFEQRVFEAAAIAHVRTGAPVCVHTEYGTMGLGIVERLVAGGVSPASIVLAHLDRNPDAVEHAETASTGAWLQFDGPGRTKYWPDSTILQLIADLCARGCDGRMLLGGDTGRRSMFRSYGGGPGLDYLFARFRPRLERELGSELAKRIFVENPARAFALRQPMGRSRGPASPLP